MRSSKPFFQALETVLKNSLPADEFAQVMEESLWEFEAEPSNPERTRSRADSVRLASVSLSFYRAMTKMGMSAETALETISRAGACLKWPNLPDTGLTCSVADFFRAKSALPLCRAVFCVSCPGSGKGCARAATVSVDWKAAGKGY